MSISSHATPPHGANARIRLDTFFSRDVGARYRPTPTTPSAVLATGDRTRANGVLRHSTWDDVVKRVSKDSTGTKDSTFSGSEKNRNVLWTSILKTVQQEFETKQSGNDALFDLADATKEANPHLQWNSFFDFDVIDHPPLTSS
ncbi:hypothetical protein CYMTET_50631 [Cymbomonas tetramitiformis]|uniref:Uncharacterized protein n=1 Tax=Cymbomonas tetramitiformis TaxID=36881 RepID=A0AAE0BMV8_9CHLO|nr:hypothetical protein CYMTET_50631 [Cymbomonas tetramitiformis]